VEPARPAPYLSWMPSSRDRTPDPDYRVHELDGFEILVGRSARDNDRLSLRVARARDLWLHAHGFAGSHVVVRPALPLGGLDPEDRPPTGQVPRHVVERAAELAAFHSKARDARGKVAVHLCRAADVSKPRGAPAGQVSLRSFEKVKVYPRG
jgi:predicted ribosome quality control (RQC) complex YloA/Tae2 family protein